MPLTAPPRSLRGGGGGTAPAANNNGGGGPELGGAPRFVGVGPPQRVRGGGARPLCWAPGVGGGRRRGGCGGVGGGCRGRGLAGGSGGEGGGGGGSGPRAITTLEPVAGYRGQPSFERVSGRQSGDGACRARDCCGPGVRKAPSRVMWS